MESEVYFLDPPLVAAQHSYTAPPADGEFMNYGLLLHAFPACKG